MRRASLILLLIAAAHGQNARPGPSDFAWRSQVKVEPAAEYASVRLKSGFYEHTRDRFNDLRLFSPRGTEVPWVIRETRLRRTTPPLRYRTLDRVRTPAGALQFVVDFGEPAGIHNVLRIEAKDTDFRRKLLLESSADRRRWDFVRTAALIRFVEDGRRLESLGVSYPDSTRRYMRVTIDDWPDPSTLTAVVCDGSVVNAEDWETLAEAVPQVTDLPDQRSTRFDVAFPFGRPGDIRLRVETPAREFYRSASLSSSRDGKSWFTESSHVIYRVAGAEELVIRARDVDTSRVRLTVFNADNPPIAIERIRIEVPGRVLMFPAAETGEYALFLDHPTSRRPDYDLDEILARKGPVEPVAMEAAAWAPNPAYVPLAPPVKPFSERFPWLLPSVLVAAVVALGYGAWRLLKQAA